LSPAGKLPVEIHEESTLEEVATIVWSALDESGISVVLSGGAAVSIYSDNEYESYDLDFVPMGLARRVDRVMESLDFSRKQRHWVHHRSRYWVEFPAGPVAIGEEIIHDFAERSSPAGRLRILHPTACVMDRLTWFIHNADPQCLDQASKSRAVTRPSSSGSNDGRRPRVQTALRASANSANGCARPKTGSLVRKRLATSNPHCRAGHPIPPARFGEATHFDPPEARGLRFGLLARPTPKTPRNRGDSQAVADCDRRVSAPADWMAVEAVWSQLVSVSLP
jgi:hypothetical protein